MRFSVTRLGAAALGLALLLALAPHASAQRFPYNGVPRGPIFGPVNPNPISGPNALRLQQYAFNVAVLGQAASNIPPYMLGYNPYPQSVNYGPSLYGNAPVNPYYGSVMASNPYYGSALASNPGGYGGGLGG